MFSLYFVWCHCKLVFKNSFLNRELKKSWKWPIFNLFVQEKVIDRFWRPFAFRNFLQLDTITLIENFISWLNLKRTSARCVVKKHSSTSNYLHYRTQVEKQSNVSRDLTLRAPTHEVYLFRVCKNMEIVKPSKSTRQLFFFEVTLDKLYSFNLFILFLLY